ncbi:MAG: SpoIID/LytB domain-containing protein [candidate division WOR-3 bacterium]
MKSKANFFFIILTFAISCTPFFVRKLKEEPTVRILLQKNPEKLELSSDSKIKLSIAEKNTLISGKISIYFNPYLRIITSEGTIEDPTLPITVHPMNKPIKIDGKLYPGIIKILKSYDILIVNEVKIEEYLKGVVPYEIGKLQEDQIEALKAQAVAARSYAMANIKSGEPFDISPTIWHQVYEGLGEPNHLIERAIESTRGIVATYKGKVIDAKYSSTCGGVTEDNENVWIGEKIPYLRSVKDSKGSGEPFCGKSPHYRWERIYDKKEFFENVKKQIKELFGEAPGKIEWIKITKRTKTNRVRTIEINTDIGKFYLEKDAIRRLFSDYRGSLKSLMFQIKVKGNQIIVSGKGYGHGVGMCQYGAMEMAKEGYNYKSILNHYYKGIKLEKLW